MIGDRGKEIACSAGKERPVLACLKMDGTPLAWSVFAEAGDVRVKSVSLVGWYVSFVEDISTSWKAARPFVVACPLLGKGQVRVSGWEDIAENGGEEYQFVARWTTLSKDVFELAREHPMLRLGFGLDYIKYATHIGKQDCADGILCYKGDCDLAGFIHKRKTSAERM